MFFARLCTCMMEQHCGSRRTDSVSISPSVRLPIRSSVLFRMSICLLCVYMCVSIYLSVRPFVCPLSVCVSICLSACLFACRSVRLSMCPSVYLSVRLSGCLSDCLYASLCPSVCLSACLSVCLYLRSQKIFGTMNATQRNASTGVGLSCPSWNLCTTMN